MARDFAIRAICLATEEEWEIVSGRESVQAMATALADAWQRGWDECQNYHVSEANRIASEMMKGQA